MRGPKDIDRPTTITITGSYFPRHGNFLCQFYDTVTQDSQCRSTGTWINAATISCQVPKMRRARKLRVLVSSDAQQFSESSVQLTTYSVLAIQPMCIPTLGQARVLVSGNNLWPEPGQSPQITAYCRFGKVSETLGSTSDDKLENWWAYHTVATVSDIEGSLECDAPPKGVLLATYDFALSLDACECGREGCPACLVKWSVPIGGQNYFYGQWDSTMGEWHQATGLPTVEMRTVIVPEIYSIIPTSGFMPGGTQVTVLGKNFTSTRCDWGANAAPTCRFGTVVTPQIHFLDASTVVCVSPPLSTGIESEVAVSVAIDGQSYVDGPNFMYIKAYGILQVRPSTASIQGGSRVTLTGPGVEEYGQQGSTFGPYRSTRGMACVYVTADRRKLVTPATFMNPIQADCPTPKTDFAQNAYVYLSPNYQSDDSQISSTFVRFMFYNIPVLSRVDDPFASISGGNVVNVQGSFFLDLDTASCMFGDVSSDWGHIVPAKFVNDGLMQCRVPPAPKPMSVPFRISLNGQDFSSDAVTFHYFDVARVTPSLVPFRGGSRVVVQAAFQGNFTLAAHMCQLPWPEETTGTNYISEDECRDRRGQWLALVYKLGFGDTKVSLEGFAGPLKNQIYFDIPRPIVDVDGHAILEASQHEMLLTIGNEVNEAFRFPHQVMYFYDLRMACANGFEPDAGSPGNCKESAPKIKQSRGSRQGSMVHLTPLRPLTQIKDVHVTCKMAKYGPGRQRIYNRIQLFNKTEDHADSFGLNVAGEPKNPDSKFKTPGDYFWGPTSLDRCSRNFKIAFDFQTGCKMGVKDSLDIQLQMTSATSTQCDWDNTNCHYNKDEVSEVESGWWKSVYVCAGPNNATERDETDRLKIQGDCGFGGFCGAASRKVDQTHIHYEPMCPYPGLAPITNSAFSAYYGPSAESEWFPNPEDASPFTASTTLLASDPRCQCNYDRQPKDAEGRSLVNCYLGTDPTLIGQCMCLGNGGSCDCKDEFHTAGEYVLEDPFAASNINCPETNNTSCEVSVYFKANINFATKTPSFEYFQLKTLNMSCESDFEIAEGNVSADGSTISCPLPPVVQGSGVEGVVLQVSLNKLDWEEELDYPHSDNPEVVSVDPKFGVHTGGTQVTVNGINFIDQDPNPIYCVFVYDDAETLVAATYVSTTRLLCVAPSISTKALNAMAIHNTLQYAVYVSLDGSMRGGTNVDGSEQDKSFNYFRQPVVESVFPDSGFTTTNQTLTVTGMSMCVYISPSDAKCRDLTVKMSYPPNCHTHSDKCHTSFSYAPVEANPTHDVSFKIYNFQKPPTAVQFGDETQPTRTVGLEIMVDGTEAVIFSLNYTFYNSSFPPAGCYADRTNEQNWDPGFLLMKCLCLKRSAIGIDGITPGKYEITDRTVPNDLAKMTEVPSRRFDWCQPLPTLVTATPRVSPVEGGGVVRLGARSIPSWNSYYGENDETGSDGLPSFFRFSCVFKFTVYRNGHWHSEYRLTNTTMLTRSTRLDAPYADTVFLWEPLEQAATCPLTESDTSSGKAQCSTLYANTAECCGFADLEKTGDEIAHRQDSYRCFQCLLPAITPTHQPLLQHDEVAAGGEPLRAHVSLAIVTEEFRPCSQTDADKHQVSWASIAGRTCDKHGNEFRYHNLTNSNFGFTSSSFFQGPLQEIHYHEGPLVKNVTPRVLPLNTSATLLVELDVTSLGAVSLRHLMTSNAKCRLEHCHVTRCTSIDDCSCDYSFLKASSTCSSDCGASCVEEDLCNVAYHDETSLLVNISRLAGGLNQSNMRALSITFNGQNWFTDLNQSITFYHLPVAVSHKQDSGSKFSFGVVTTNVLGEYFRLSSLTPGTRLISYMREAVGEAPCTGTSVLGIDCVWRIPRPALADQNSSDVGSSSDDGQERRSPRAGEPQLIYRFSPGQCSANDVQAYFEMGAGYQRGEASCCQSGLDVSMEFTQIEGGFFSKIEGTAPVVAAPGEYHLCFSLDGLYFVPMAFNHFTTHVSKADKTSYEETDCEKPSTNNRQGCDCGERPCRPRVATFLFYNLSITGQTLLQGPTISSPEDEYELSLLGSGFPLASKLQNYAPSVRVYFESKHFQHVSVSSTAEAGPASFSSSRRRIISPSIISIESDELISVKLTMRCSGSIDANGECLDPNDDKEMVPQVELGSDETSRAYLVYISIDDREKLPPQGIPFTFFPKPTVTAWFPLYGLFETETQITVTGTRFTDTGEARCRFPGASCAAEDGSSIFPCIRGARYVSPTAYTCVVPSKRSEVNGQVEPSNQAMEFSIFAAEPLKVQCIQSGSDCLYENLFIKSAEDFLFHAKFSKLVLDAFSAPVNAPEMGTDMRTLAIDATDQKFLRPGSEPTCLNFEKIHNERAIKLALRNDGAVVSTNMIEVQVDRVLNTIGRGGGCPVLEGYCVGLILLKNRGSKPVLNDGAGYPEILQCYPSQGNKNGDIDCCTAKGMDADIVDGEDRGSCCPDLSNDMWQYGANDELFFNDPDLLEQAFMQGRIEQNLYDPELDTIQYRALQCKYPNWKKYPERVCVRSRACVHVCASERASVRARVRLHMLQFLR